MNEEKKDAGTVEEDEDELAEKYMDEEEMLDIAEHCFIRLAEVMLEKNRSIRGLFTKYSVPE